jgi:conjugal transfer/type IV secretion protein DotA/TraY
MNYHSIIGNIPQSGSTQLLAMLFGGEVYNIFGGGNFHGPQETMLTLFGSILVHSGVVVWMYVAIMGYFFYSGLVNKSQNGDFMLRSWNGFWPWIRMTFGLTAVVPSFTVKNLVAIQTLVLSVALMASSIADLTWKNLLDVSAKYGLTAQHVLTPNIDTSKTDAYLNDAFKYSACLANKLKYNNTDDAVSLSDIDPINPDITSQGELIASSCGGEKFLSFLSAARNQEAPQAPDLTPQQGSDLISGEQQAKYNQYQSAQFNYLENQTIIDFIRNRVWHFYLNNMDILGQSQVPASLAIQWQGILTDFHQTLKDKIQSALLSDKGMAADVFSNQVSKYGWISAANYYKQLANEQQIINSQISAGLQNTPNFVDLDQQKDLTNADSMTSFHVAKAENWAEKASDRLESGAAKYLLDPLGINFLKMGEGIDPFLAMTNFGQKLEGISEVVLALRETPKLLDKVPVVGHWLSQKVGGMFSGEGVSFILMALTVSGVILGVILPNLPWIFFLFAIISWLIYVAEMFIAAPFWVVANALPEGDTFLSNVAKKGINNVMFIALFPVLAVGGLVASLSISWIGISLLNHFAYLSFKRMEGWTLPFDVVGIVLTYVVLAWMIMMNSLSMIQMFPRTILNWLSLSQPGLNQFDDAHLNAKDKLMNATNPSGLLLEGAGIARNAEKNRALKHVDDLKERRLKEMETTDDSEKK